MQNELRDIQGVTDSYQSEIEQYPVVRRKVDDLNALIRDIEAMAKKTATSITGTTKTKGDVKKRMALSAAEVAAAGAAYAAEKRDLQLAGIFRVSYSDVRYSKDEDALNTVGMLLDELEKLPEADRDEFMIFADDLAELHQLAEEFREVSKVQGSQTAESKAAHRALNILFDQANTLLRDSLDKLMLRLKRKEPELVEAYFNVRSYGNVMVETELRRSSPPPIEMT